MLRAAVSTSAALALLLVIAVPVDARGRGGFCNYCGCTGGPGYRAPDGKCVGKRNITKVCGSPPSTRCKFEGKSGGLNQTPSPTHHPEVTNPFAG